jgi:hypothetical protein
MTVDGPDLWVSVEVPAGVHRLSLYFYNKDGHIADNRFRDYLVELRLITEKLPPWPTSPKPPTDTKQFVRQFDAYWKQRSEIISRESINPVLARARVRDFWGPVYKQFLVCGPACYWVRISRNNSFNTILQAVMIDKLAGPSSPFDDVPMAWMGGVRDTPPDPDAPAPIDPHLLDKLLAAPGATGAATGGTSAPDRGETALVASSRLLWRCLDESLVKDRAAELQWPYRLLAYRAAANARAPRVLLENWRWKLPLWTPEDRSAWESTMKKAHDTLLELNPDMKGRPY